MSNSIDETDVCSDSSMGRSVTGTSFAVLAFWCGYILALVVSGSLAVATAVADDFESLRVKSTTPVEIGVPVERELCTKASIISSSGALSSDSLHRAIDGDASTGLDLFALEDATLDIEFFGRPPWLDVVTILHKGRVDFQISVKDVYGNEKVLPFSCESAEHPDGTTETILLCEGSRVSGLLIRPLPHAFPRGAELTLLEVQARYRGSTDTDDGKNEYGDEWIKTYKGTECGGSNLSQTQRDATRAYYTGLKDIGGWDYAFDWGNMWAWEQDFTVNGSPWDVDKVDLCYFSGHGTTGGFKFSEGKHLDCWAERAECFVEWGDDDMEWIVISACRTLDTDPTNIWEWFSCFDGLHLMCGMHTPMLDKAYGPKFGRNLESSMTVTQAWFDAVYRKSRPTFPPIYTTTYTCVVVAEDMVYFNDRVWGAGYVSPDPVHQVPGFFKTYTFKGLKTPAAGHVFERSQAEIVASPVSDAPPLLALKDLLGRSPADSIPQLVVSPRFVDSAYVESIADSLCNYSGILCNCDIEYDDSDSIFYAFDGPHQLEVDCHSGAWEYMHTEEYAIAGLTEPSLLSEAEVSDSAAALLEGIGISPADAVEAEPSWLHLTAFDDRPEFEIPDSSFDLSITTAYSRVHNGYHVAGPGANIRVEYGDGAVLQRLIQDGWRDVVTGPLVQTISLQEALEDLAYCGTDLLMQDIPLCDTFLVEVAELGYYEAPGDTTANELVPVWIVGGGCVLETDGLSDTDYCELLIPACEGCRYGAVCPPTIEIGKIHNALQGHYQTVSIITSSSIMQSGGFDFLIAYDASALSAIQVVAGQLLEDCGWEYFAFRLGPIGNCGDACPSGLLRIVAIAETNNGSNHPSCFGPPDEDPYELAEMTFLVTNDRTFECQYVPIWFFWADCGDNAVSSVDGTELYVDMKIYDFEGNLIWDESQDDLFPETSRIPYVGVPDSCLQNDRPKPPPIRFLNFVNGGIDIVCADSIDVRGDINLNEIGYEVADAVMFANYFVYGISVFTVNPPGQIAASDVNADGITLSVADIVYLIRVVIGDASPYPKPVTPVAADYEVGYDGVMSVAGNISMGAALVVVEGKVTPALLADDMDLLYNCDGKNTRILVYSLEGNSFTGDFLKVDGKVLSVEMATADANPVVAELLPSHFALHQNYPNPFNPITTLSFDVTEPVDYVLTIYNVSGQTVERFSGRAEPGTERLEWDASACASGVYLYQLEAGNFTDTKKMVLLK